MYHLKQSEIPRVRDELLEIQSGVCPICKREITDPVLDHHHTKKIKGSGQIRGVICRTCNVFLGKIENNAMRYRVSSCDLPIVLRNIADYLDEGCYEFLHPSETPKQPKLKKSNYNELRRTIEYCHPNRKIPPYPKSKKLTKDLEKLYIEYDIEPEYYK